MPAKCSRCNDRGYTYHGTRQDTSRIWEPCACPAGAPWRDVAAAEESPPACIDCGAVAEIMILSIRPRCKACENKYNDLRRARMEVWS